MNTQTSYFKKALVVLMAVIMVFTMMPSMAWADSNNATQSEIASVNIYVTVSLGTGEAARDFAKAKDGTDMAMKRVMVSDVDNDGKLTAYDAISCMQTQWAPEEKEWAVDDKNIVTKLWGEDAPFLIYSSMVTQIRSFNQGGVKTNPSNFSISENMQLYITQGLTTSYFTSAADLKPMLTNTSKVIALKESEFSIYSRKFLMTTPTKFYKSTPTAETDVIINYKKIRGTDAGTLSCDADGKINVRFDEAGEYLIYKKTPNGAAAIIVEVLETAPRITDLQVKNAFGDSILVEESSKYSIVVDEDNTQGEISLRMGSDTQLENLLYGWKQASTQRNIYIGRVGVNPIEKDTAIGNENAIKLYIYDKNIGPNSSLAEASAIDVEIKRAAVLSGLTTSGQTKKDSNFKSGTLYAYVKSDAQTASVTPSVSGEGYSITIDGKAAEAGKANRVYVDLSSGESRSTVTVSKEGFVDKHYQVVFLAAQTEKTPFFVENLSENKDEYVVGDKITPLKVFATASGEVEYQWYSAVSADGDGVAIEGAVKAEYTPSNEVANDAVYYCIATNKSESGEASVATSEKKQVIVYDNPITDFSWDVGTIPDLPTDKADKFGGNTKGFYYDNDTSTDDIVTLKVKAMIPKKVLAAGATVKYNWEVRRGTTVEIDEDAGINRTINREEGYTGGTNYRVYITVSFLGRYFTRVTDTLYVYTDFKTHAPNEISWKGEGTANNPWLLETTDDIVKLRDYVNEGYDFFDTFLKFDKDISLPNDWVPIGKLKDETKTSIEKGANLYAFSGTIDGDNHLLTIPEGEKPLLAYVFGAEIKNLNIYGKRIEGYGLINNIAGVGLVGSAVIIDNVTLKSGTTTLKSGLIGGELMENPFAAVSAGFVTTIRNCTIEEGVVIGYSGKITNIGSFAGALQGSIENCTSYATVKGKNNVGGIIGTRDNAIGNCTVENCKFYGSVNGEKAVGGIVGSGYGDISAPNGDRININNCRNEGTVTGITNVGGILGSDPRVAQVWGAYTFIGNVATGKVTGESNVGAIIGFYKSLNKLDNVAYNFYTKDCEALKGIGAVELVDTNCDKPTANEGTTYFSTEKSVSGCPVVSACGWKVGYNRTDDPLGKDAENLTKLVDDAGINICYKIEIEEGSYRDTYYRGEALDLKDAVIKASWTDGTITQLSANDLKITGYDKSKRAVQTVTLSYNGVSTTINIVVLEPVQPGDPGINVSFLLLGDKIHDADAEGATKHALSAGNLDRWLSVTKNVEKNSTVWNLMQKIEKESIDPKVKFNARGSQYGAYVESVTYNGLTLGEIDNGKNSGWMYTVNGSHPEVGVGSYFLNDGDSVIFHYTDDYTKEEGTDKWNTPGGTVEEVKDVTTDTKSGTTTAPTEVKVSEKTNADGTKTKVADVKVSVDNQKEILKQAKEKKSNEIILVVSGKEVGDAAKADVTLDKSFIDSIVKDTNAKLTIKTPFGDKTYTQDELKAMSEAATGSTVTVAIEKAAEPTDDAAAKIAKAKSIVKDMKLVARSSKTAKKNIKAVLKSDAKVTASIKELKDLGFTVKYRFYRSTKKAASYKSTVTKRVASYTNTSGKKGTKYFYKVQVRVYDENGKLVAKTALKQCKYASRTWTK